MNMLPGFVFEAQVGCWCCKFYKEIAITRRRLLTNKALVYTGVISYMVMIMITVAFSTAPAVEGTLLTVGVLFFIIGIRAVRRFISITQQFYPEVADAITRRWAAVRLCFVVIGLQGFLLRLFSAIQLIPPLGIFNKIVVVDVFHNMLVPVELSFAMILAHRAFGEDLAMTIEETPLLPKLQRGNTGSQTDVLLSNTPARVDSGVDSPENSTHGYGSLSVEMMEHVDQAIEENWRRSHPDLQQAYQGCKLGSGRYFLSERYSSPDTFSNLNSYSIL